MQAKKKKAKKKQKKDLCISLYILTEKKKTPWIKSIIRGGHITREIPNSQRWIINKKW